MKSSDAPVAGRVLLTLNTWCTGWHTGCTSLDQLGAAPECFVQSRSIRIDHSKEDDGGSFLSIAADDIGSGSDRILEMSRYRLAWYELEQQQSGDWLVKLPLCDVYSGIIDRAFPAFRHIGWRADTKGTGYTYFKSLAPDEVEQIERFLKFLEKHLLLCLNKNLESEFTDELDECYALDYNLRDSASYTRTDIGRMEYEAKYNQDEQCAKKLADTIAAILDIHPSLASVDFIVAVPGNSEKNFHLPDLLVSFIGKTLGRSTGFSLTKVKHTPQLKTLPVDEKLRILEGAFAMSKDVTGHSILLIDDLYQSGATMWTLVRFLKEKGAAAVFGLACVKSWRDSDNV